MKLRQKQSPPVDLIDQILSANDPTPCLSPVNQAILFQELVSLIRQFVIMSEETATASALWTFHTYCYELFEHSPLLLINAPERACGKTAALSVIAKLVPKAMVVSNITEAGLFRLVANRAPTLLIDEADTFCEGKPELAGLLNKGYEKGGIVIRVEKMGDQMVETGYLVFGPKALAGIDLARRLPDATISRGIEIAMRRKVKGEVVQRLRSIDPALFARLRSQINRFVKDHAEQLAQGYDDMPEELDDRAQDCWEPLFAIAAAIGPEVLAKAKAAALAIHASKQEAESVSNNLLACIREVLQDFAGDRIPSAQLLTKLTADEEMGWSTYNKGFPLTPRQLSRNLKPYGIASKTVRMKDGSTPKGYEVKDFQDAFERYLKPLEHETEAVVDPMQEDPGKAPAKMSKQAQEALDAYRQKRAAEKLAQSIATTEAVDSGLALSLLDMG